VIPPPLDLYNATKLKTVEFSWVISSIRWITATLQTIKPGTLQHIIIHLFISPLDPTLQAAHQEWRDLDRFLIGLWNSRSILPKVVCEATIGDDEFEEFARYFIPELMGRGVVSQVVRP
jgi:hypothetical protein